MKTKLCMLLLAGMLFMQNVDAQQEEEILSETPSQLISTNVPLTALGWLNAKYEKRLNEKSSVIFMADAIITFLPEGYFAGGLGFGYKHYITHKKVPVPEGFFVQPSVRGYLGDLGDGFAIGPALEVGYLIVWPSGVSLDLGLGPGVFLNDGTAILLPTGSINLGYAW